MSYQQTSFRPWQNVQTSLGERQQQVLDVIRELPQCDNLMISQKLRLPINSITPRVNELRKLGRVKEVGQFRNAMTGRPTMRWEVA